MFAIRIHGRGGQGVVTAAEVLSTAAFTEGRHAQAFPSFGSERTGAPVVAFCRLDERPIRLREPVGEPDAVIVADATLLHYVDVFAGLRADGYALVNSERSWADLGLTELAAKLGSRALIMPATRFALAHLGRPLPNVALLGGLAALTGLISLAGLQAALTDKLPAAVVAGNVAAAAQAYRFVQEVSGAHTH
jgi:pyruvate ferredoxin oxidoreductase gamma subunit